MWPRLLVVLVVLSSGCTAPEDSPEARVRVWLEAAEAVVEARDLPAARELIAPGYQDSQGQDRRALVRLLAGYLLRQRSPHLVTHIRRLEFPDPTRARMLVDVAMAATDSDDTQALFGLQADVYRFDLELALEDDRWLLTRADWRPLRPAAAP